jgi:ADP-heptose:LPS heptosyltransferase
MDVAWMIGPTERDWYGQPYVDRFARTAPVVEEHDICAAADRLARCDVFIGNDAGTTHLAAALGLHVVALFRSTDPEVWRPLGPRVHVVSLDGSAGSMSRPDIEAILAVVSG